MEKRKLLLVIVSVGVFLVVVIGASILVFSPKVRGTEAMASAGAPIPAGQTGTTGTAPVGPTTADPTEWIRNPQGIQGLQEPPQPTATTRGDVIIIYGDNAVQGRPAAALSAGESVAGSTGTLVIEVPKPAGTQTPTPAPADAAALPAAPAPVPAEKQQQNTTVRTSTATTTPKARETKVYDDYWVQTGAFSTKAGAESAKEHLAAKGISSVMEIKAVQDKTYYRVRVGPYTSKNEADYWLSLVKSIDGFGESYVSVVKARR